MINLEKIKYFHSAFNVNQLISDNLPQFAFVGRSNVGKSSLINTLTNKKKLAHISKKPGKTRLVNYFLVEEHLYLVDLPGYGFANVPTSMRDQWQKLIENYLLNTEQLVTTFLLWDIRNCPAKNDVQLLNWFLHYKLPFQIILTKADKLTKNQKAKRMIEIGKSLPFPFPMVEFSAMDRRGKDYLIQFIQNKWEEYN